MISWIQTSFQHYFRFIFGLVLAGTIIAFIMEIGSTPGLNRGDRVAATRLFFGHNLMSSEDMQPVMTGASISLQLQTAGDDEPTAEQVQAYALNRVAALHLADQLHIPAASDTAIATHVRTLSRFLDKNGDFDPSLYDSYRAALHTNSRISEADVARVLGEDVRIESIEKLLAGPGYVLPSDVRAQAAEGDTSWKVAIASLDYASYKPDYEPTSADLEQYFSEYSSHYEISPRIEADAIIVSTSAYAPEVSVTDDEVRALYDRDPSRFQAPPAKSGAKVDPSADYAAVRPEVEVVLRTERAREIAAKAASDLAYDLYQSKIQPGASLDAWLASHKLTTKALTPFTHDAGPEELGRSSEIADAAFKLNADKFYSDPLPCPQGSVILLWKNLLPARQPALAEVREAVRGDAIENMKRQRFVALGQTLKSSIQAALKSGSTFDHAVHAAAAAAGVNVTIRIPSPFTFRSRPEDISPSILGSMEHLGKGEVSDMTTSETGGTLVYAVDRSTPSLDVGSPAYSAARRQLALISSRSASQAAFSEIVNAEILRSAPVAAR